MFNVHSLITKVWTCLHVKWGFSDALGSILRQMLSLVPSKVHMRDSGTFPSETQLLFMITNANWIDYKPSFASNLAASSPSAQEPVTKQSLMLSSIYTLHHYHCYNGDVSFLQENRNFDLSPIKSEPFNRLTHNLSGLITSTRGMFVPKLGENPFTGDFWANG